MCLKMFFFIFNVFNCMEDGLYYDQCVDGVQDVDVVNLWGVDLVGGVGWVFGYFVVEKFGYDDEEFEDDELDVEIVDNEVVVKVVF